MSRLSIGLLLSVASVCVAVPVVGAQSTDWLERLSGPRAQRRLLSGSLDARRDAARELALRGAREPALRALEEALRAENASEVRSEIIRSITFRGGQQASEILIEAFREPDLSIANPVARALGALASPGAIGTLVEALGDPRLQGPARQGLLRAGSEAVVPLTRAARDVQLRGSVLDLLASVGDRRATWAVVDGLRDERPEVRLSALRAAAAIGDTRAGPMVARLLDEEDPELRSAALEALDAVGSPAHAPAVADALADESLRVRRAALSALLALDPDSGVARMEAAVGSSEDPLGVHAVELSLVSRDPRMVPILYGVAQEGTRAPEALSALGEVDGGAGLGVLLTLSREEGANGEHALRALAVGLRRWGDAAPDHDRLLSRVREAGSLRIRGLARDPQAVTAAMEALGESEAATRRDAAETLFALVSGSPATGRQVAEPLVMALAQEEDPSAFASEVRVALAARAPIPMSVVWRWLERPEARAEALWMAGWVVRGRLEQPSARRLRRELRRALQEGELRVRAAAARGLAVANDRRAWRALASALDDPAAEVRLAVAHALRALPVAAAQEVLSGHARVEADPRVATALRDAATPGRRAIDPLDPGGLQVLRVRVVPSNTSATKVPVDVILADGTWLQTETDARGELILVDLPAEAVDVRIGP